MNHTANLVYELWRLRELGLGGNELKLQRNSFSRYNVVSRKTLKSPVKVETALCRKFSLEDEDPYASSSKRLRLDIEGNYSQFVEPVLSPSEQLSSTSEVLIEDAAFQRLPSLFREHTVDLLNYNKVFASTWLNNNSIVMGTKCNKILVYDTVTSKLTLVPSLKAYSAPTFPAEHNCGIHALDINPSRRLIAIGAENPCDLGVYRLPSFEPVTIGDDAHRDWIFTMQWLDDDFLATGSRDSTIALWKIPERPTEHIECSHAKWIRFSPNYRYPCSRPLIVKRLGSNFEKCRALSYNHSSRVIVAVSLNSYLYMLDVETFEQVQIRRLMNLTECVCICHSPDEKLLAVGCKQNLLFCDAKTLETVKTVQLPELSSLGGRNQERLETILPAGIRSISWHGPLVTMGTTRGEVLFYDVRAQKYLDCHCGMRAMLRASSGWLYEDDLYMDFFRNMAMPNAIYTHCYDESRTRLFTAGGPIAASLLGNYGAIWR